MTHTPAGAPDRPPAGGIIQLLIGSVLISFSAVFVKLVDVGPTASGFYRNLFGAAALLVFVVVRRETMWRGRGPVLWACFGGALFAADIFFWHRSIIFVGPGLATILGNFQVFFLAAVGILVLRERVTWRFVVAIPLALTGLFMLVGVDWGSLDAGYKVGVGFGVLTAISYASYLLVLQRSQRAERRLGPMPNLAVISAFTALLLAGSVLVEGESFAIPNGRSWAALVAYGVVCQALGWIVISKGLVKMDASRAGLVLLLQPTLTFIWDMVFFDRPTTGIEIVGALLALAAIYLGNTGSGRREAKPA